MDCNYVILEAVRHNHQMLHHITDMLVAQNDMLVAIAAAVQPSPELNAAVAALKTKTDALQAALAAAPK